MNCRMRTALMFLLWIPLLGGCSSAELEEKNFPMAAAIAWQEDGYEMALGFQQLSDVADENASAEDNTDVMVFGENGYELFEEADAKNPGQMDYNHMKALIFSEDIFSDEERLNELFSCMEEQNVIARNTLLFVTEDEPQEVIKSSARLKDNVGNYLQELITSNQDYETEAAVTLGDLMNVWYNRNETLMIPRVMATEEGLELSDYYVMRGRTPVGTISFEQGEFMLLSCGKLRYYGVPVEDHVIRLSDLSCHYEISGDGDQVTETVYLSANATAYAGEVPEGMEQYMETLCSQTAAGLLETGIDVTNSYYRLGGYNRSAYERYCGDYQGYQENLNIRYVWDIRETS